MCRKDTRFGAFCPTRGASNEPGNCRDRKVVVLIDVRGESRYPSVLSRAAVAQWIEYWPPKPRVAGSIPASRTTPPGSPRFKFPIVLTQHQPPDRPLSPVLLT